MAVFKCKMCGGSLDIADGVSVATCEYCGTKQTLPKLSDERKANLYDRANHFRRNNEFDKAMGIYEQILNDDSTDAESYWSLVLCRYGIEYVEDPATRKRIPTVNRTQFTSVFDDEDYKSAIEYADESQREVYETEAVAINQIQKGILAISEREEPFDVFICYKESDNSGRRTPDSVLATELYHELVREGFKVFFARITLEDKLGQEYEPYIFAALNSAKVMVVLGTKPEYFNSVWVKNEWSRYLALIKNGARKVLIPAYRDMDPYDLPEEFSHLQAQDMSKLGFMQDLIRGIKKIAQVEAPRVSTQKPIVPTNNTEKKNNLPTLIKRAFIAVEDGEWRKAKNFCEQILEIDPECADAYLVKLMAELKVNKQEQLADCKIAFNKNNNYIRAVRFGHKELKEICQKNLEQLCITKEKKRKKRKKLIKIIVSSTATVVAITVFLVFFNFNMWTDMVAVSAGNDHTVGLKSDGTVVAVGYNRYGQCNVSNWTDIVAVSVGQEHTVALNKKGFVVAAGNNYSGQCNVEGWTDIVAVSAGNYHTEGLKKDGTVVAVGNNDYGQCNVDDWENIIAVSAGYHHTVGLKSDGTVVAVGYNRYGQCNVSNWTDIVAVSAGYHHTVGLKSDGTVVAVGNNDYGQCNVDDWTDIIAVSAGKIYTVGVKSDGSAVVMGHNAHGQLGDSNWTDIVAISAGEYHIVGIKSDGTAVAIGNNSWCQCDVGRWRRFY